MFWRFGFHSQSALDVLLDKDNVTLNEVLEEEDVLQECKSPNRKLIDLYVDALRLADACLSDARCAALDRCH